MFTGIVREFLAGLLALLMTAAPAATTVQPVEEPAYVQEVETVSPARTLSATAGTLSLDVDSPVGSLPKAAKASLSKVSKAKLNKIRKEAASLLGTEIIDAVAFDISFLNNGVEIEPDGKVNITVNFPEISEAPKYTILHFKDDGTTEIVAGNVTSTSATFEADSFSVYAVVGTPKYKRLTVRFNNGDTLIETMYVKDSDNAEDIKTIIYDPGAGTNAADLTFFGWTRDKNYTSDSVAFSIPQIRTAVFNRINEADFEDGEEWDYYACYFRVYKITYLDEKQVSLGTDELKFLENETSGSYKISKTYSPADPTTNFEGWITTDTANIENAQYQGTAVTAPPYKMGTTMTVKGNITFTVSAPKGNWLVFNENGKGATYVAPQFVKSGDVTKAPTITMKRLGYTFGGWYTDQACTTGNEFTFGGQIHQRTNVYAKWVVVPTATYVVLIWKQNVTGTGYDFAASKTQENATVNANISVTNNNNNVTVSGGGKSYTYNRETGFKFKEADSGKTVSPEGNTVVNVYYDRETVTFNFHVYDYTYTVSTNDNDNNPAKYGDVNGQKARVYWQNGAFRTSNSYYGTVYSGTVYTRSNNQSWQTVQTMTGLYGSTLAENNYTWPTDYDWYLSYSNNQGSGTRRTFMDAFIPAGVTGMTHNFYARTSSGTATIYFYKQNENLNGYTVANTVRVDGNTTFTLSDKYNGFKLVSYSTNGNNYSTNVGTPNSQGYYNSVSFNSQLHIRFDRKVYNILFKDGVYVDGNNNKITDQPNLGQLKVVENIAYGATTSSYNKGQTNYYDPSTDHTIAGFVFEGWYIDDACTSPYTFTTMPEGITVYAKWRQIQYRVFLHPNATLPDGTNDSSLDWGDEGRVDEHGNPDPQAMNFRISYMGQVSIPVGIRTEYEFIGWFTDPAMTIPYNEDTKLTEAIVTSDYDKTLTANYTDRMNKFGEIEGQGWNSDITGWDHDGDSNTVGLDRYWITKKLDLYGKWSAVLIGANGINVAYDLNGGSGSPTDPNQYKDNVDAVAVSAPTTAPQGKKFECWILQKWDASANNGAGGYVDTSVTVYPGAKFTVLKANAKDFATGEYLKDSAGNYLDNNGIPTTDPSKYVEIHVYTVQLRAEYSDIEIETPTHIIWYANGGEMSSSFSDPNVQSDETKYGVVTDTKTITYYNLRINEAISILPAATVSREGYRFLGWARVLEPDGAFVYISTSNKTINQDAFSPDDDLTAADLYLVYDKANNKYTCTVNGDDVDVTQVAADENLIVVDEKEYYQALYAVWEKLPEFYIYHSGVAGGAVETVYITDDMKAAGYAGFNLREKTTSGTYYGGYYTDGQCTPPAAVNDIIPAYDGTNWTWDPPANYTEKGSAITPQEGVTYYIKEVPRYYMLPYAHMTYQGGIVKNLLVVTDFDDYTYALGGFTVNGTDVNMNGDAVFYTSLKVTTSVGGSTMILKPGELYTNELFPGYVAENYTVQGYIGYLWINSYLATAQASATDTEPAKIKVGMWWKTPDGEIVRSDVTRTIVIENNTVDGIYYTDSDATATAVGGGN
jgi:uncharacterized repeat protein (TIGR02543 family)